MPPAEQRRRCSYRSLEVSSVFWVDPSVLVLFGRPCCLKNCDCDRHDFFKAPPPGYAVLWSVGVGAAGAPVAIRRGSRFIASVVVVDKAQTADGLPRGRWPSVNMPRQVGSTSFSDSIQSTPEKLFLDFFVNWIESSFPRPEIEMPSWLFIF